MKWLNRLRWAFGRAVTKAGLTMMPPWLVASFLEPTWGRLVADGYKKNAAFLACVGTLSFGFPEPPLLVKDKDDEPLYNHPLMQLMMRPNPRMGEATLMATTMTYLSIGGNAYWHKVRNGAGQVVEVWPYHGGQMIPVGGGSAWVDHYDFDNGSGEFQRVPVDDVIHFQWPLRDPDQPWMAIPPLIAAAREVDTDNEATRYLYALLKNDAVPRTVVTTPPDRDLTDDEYKRFKAQWREKYGGDNRGEVALLEGGATVTRLSLNLEELAFEALHRIPEARIASVMRVPPILAGLNVGLERSTFSNYGEARKSFVQDTLSPLWRIFESEITANLLPEYGDDSGRVVYDRSEVQALQEDETQRWTRVTSAHEKGVLGWKETRAALGYDPEPPKDDFFVVSVSRYLAPTEEILNPPDPEPTALPAPSKEEEEDPAEGNATEEEEGSKAFRPDPESKSARRAIRQAKALRKIRQEVAKRFEGALSAYFEELAADVLQRAQKGTQGNVERKADDDALPSLSDLRLSSDDRTLTEVVKRYYMTLLEESWDMWNAELGVTLAFDLTNPVVTALLREAENRTKDISKVTWEAVKDALAYANEQGWSVDDLVRGDDNQRGLKDIVSETYKNRARNIARTELGTAQQKAAADRYAEAGVKKVYVLDNGVEDSDPVCREIAGTVQTIEWAKANPLQHPGCFRCFAAYFGD